MRFIQPYIKGLMSFMSGGYPNVIISIGLSLLIVMGTKMLFLSRAEAVTIRNGIAYRSEHAGVLAGWISALSILNLISVACCAAVVCSKQVKEDYTVAYVEMRKAADASLANAVPDVKTSRDVINIVASKNDLRPALCSLSNTNALADIPQDGFTRTVVMLAN